MSFDDEKRAHKKRDKKSHGKGLTEKIYRKPQLFIYGNIREITQSTSNAGMGDSVVHGKTGF